MSHSLLYLSQARAAVELMSAVAHGDECVSLRCAPGLSTAAVLDEAENKLSGHGLRCVRVYGPASGGLCLRDLVGQIVARADPDALTDVDLKAGFATLTEPGEGYDRVALLVTEAQNLLPAAMRYIQLACRSSPKLRIALAGQPGLAGALAPDEFAYLRQRITRTLELPGPVRGKAPGPWSVLAGLCRGRAGPLVRLGLAAASVLLIAAAGWHLGPVPPETAMRAGDAGPAEPAAAQHEGEAAVGRQAEASPPEPGPANASMPGQSDAPAEQGAAPPGPSAKPAADRARDVLPASIPAPGTMEPAPSAVTSLPILTAASVPVPPPPRSSPAVALPFLDASQARRPRGETERAAAALPTRPTDERRCRDIVFHAQLGKDLSNADQSFLRDGCRAK